jgi:hypothetical protein
MSQTVENALAVLRAHGIHPYESEEGVANPPSIGTIEEGKAVYSTSLDDIGLARDGEASFGCAWQSSNLTAAKHAAGEATATHSFPIIAMIRTRLHLLHTETILEPDL